MSIDCFKRTARHLTGMRMQIIAVKLFCLFAGLSLWPAHAEACYPLQLSLATPVQLAPKESDVCGVRLDLFWGENKAVWGIDAGLANGAESIRGIEAGALFNRLESAPGSPVPESWGFQAAGLINANRRTSFTGLQAAGLANDNDRSSVRGIQAALFSNQNYESEVTGIQTALFNQAQKLNGFQIGLGNGVSAGEGAVGMIVAPIMLMGAIAGVPLPLPLYHDLRAHKGAAMNGVQAGVFVNSTQNMNGLQMGLMNHAGTSSNGFQIGLINGGDLSNIFTAGNNMSMRGVQIGDINVAGDTAGLQLGGINRAEKERGFQIGFVNISDAMTGLQIAFGNKADEVNGIQIGYVMNIGDDMTGLQLAVFNIARDVTGVQIGFMNICKNLKGFQVGALNGVTGSAFGMGSFMPFINAGF